MQLAQIWSKEAAYGENKLMHIKVEEVLRLLVVQYGHNLPHPTYSLKFGNVCATAPSRWRERQTKAITQISRRFEFTRCFRGRRIDLGEREGKSEGCKLQFPWLPSHYLTSIEFGRSVRTRHNITVWQMSISLWQFLGNIQMNLRHFASFM